MGRKVRGKMLVGGSRVGDKVILPVSFSLSASQLKRVQGFFIEPTIFTDVDIDSEIHTQEIFVPIAVVRRFKTEEEVMAMSNDTKFGLMAGVFTQDINKALRVASEFESGNGWRQLYELYVLHNAFWRK